MDDKILSSPPLDHPTSHDHSLYKNRSTYLPHLSPLPQLQDTFMSSHIEGNSSGGGLWSSQRNQARVFSTSFQFLLTTAKYPLVFNLDISSHNHITGMKYLPSLPLSILEETSLPQPCVKPTSLEDLNLICPTH